MLDYAISANHADMVADIDMKLCGSGGRTTPVIPGMRPAAHWVQL